MSFLFPLYLAGAAAVALPIYLHLRRRPPKDAVEFSSLMFLEPTKHQPLKRRSQLEHIALLILRCLALLLLAAMFSRPFFAGGDEDGEAGQKRTVILLDVSASMRRDGLWEKAAHVAKQAVTKVRADSSLALMTVGQTPRTLVTFDDWLNADPARRAEIARSAIDEIGPGWSGSDIGSGLIAAAEMVADASGDEDSSLPAEIIVISDLQSGAALDAVAEAAWPGELSVVLEPVEAVSSDNANIVAAATADPKKPTVRVRNGAESESQQFQIVAGDQRITAVVPPGESRRFQLEKPASELVLTGDREPFDNRLFLAPHEAATVTLQFVGNGRPDDSNGPEYFFRRAFGLSDVFKPEFVDDLSAAPAILAIARPLDRPEAEAVRARLEAGGSVLLIVTDTNMAKTLGGLAGVELDLEEYDGRYALLEQIDFDHPALSEFRDPRWRDFTKVHFWRHREIDVSDLPGGSTVFAKFDSGAPAWIEVPVGEGSLVVMMSGWHPRDSQLSLSSKFVPLLFSIFSNARPGMGGVRQLFVGEPLPLEGKQRIVSPDGESSSVGEGERFYPSEPGVYRVDGGSSFAVNLRPSESELAPLSKESLVALGVPVGKPVASESESGSRSLRNQESEAAQNLWRWAVVALLVLLLVESWLGLRSTAAKLAIEASA